MKIKNIVLSTLGVFLIGLAITLVYTQSSEVGYNFGAGPWDAFNGDFSSATSLPVSFIVFAEGLVLLIIAKLYAKTRFAWLALLTGFLISFSINITAPVANFIHPVSTWGNLVIFATYLFLLTMGVALCIESKFFISPIEKASIDAYYETNLKTKIHYKYYRSLYESLPVWGTLLVILIAPAVNLQTTNLTIFTVGAFIFMGPMIYSHRMWIKKLLFRGEHNEI